MIQLLLALLAVVVLTLISLRGVLTPREPSAPPEPRVNALERARSVEPLLLQRPQVLERELEGDKGPVR